jgi:hypothetical protein
MKPAREQPPVDGADDLIDSIAENEAAVFNGHPRFGAGHETAIDVNDVSLSHCSLVRGAEGCERLPAVGIVLLSL